ncbi:MAG: M23 family metallopeptidase [Xanthomonadales bacterium]|nr:M23 family metallopeptidase [Gammaproteobacteria bacterium]MBT8050493.1 M23 family metallopeptidase [Gammaproteobacteria bacterium]NNJ77981.1 M23 family metallopeptidase [Xanthomonadales bacterium]NNL04416.1 M23 family metallopeptidase [Xanthomonadales bacterium]
MKPTSATAHNTSSNSATKASTLARLRNPLLAAAFVAFITLVFFAGRSTAPQADLVLRDMASLKLAIQEQQAEVDRLRIHNRHNVDALAIRLGELQAASTRLDALGERLAQMGQLSLDEFDFGEPAPLGGTSDLDLLGPYTEADLRVAILDLGDKLRRQSTQLDALQSLMVGRQLESDLTPAGWPVRKGWISSRFGERSDPLTGQRTMHWGYDFSGHRGTDVLSVAAGVVTWAGPRSTFGNTVEIDHGNGYVTRYAHNKSLTVKPGDQVTAGQVIAGLGNSGRSSGPHVHFEVIRNGQRVNPAKFIKQLR